MVAALSGLFVLGATLVSATPAQAIGSGDLTGAQPAYATSGRVMVAGPAYITSVRGTGAQELAAACNGFQFNAFGYTGCFRSGSGVMGCYWDGDGFVDEWFGISPGRRIFHVWPSSGGWKEMPNDGRADDTWNCYWNGNGQRQVEVWTAADNVFYSYYSGGWSRWIYYPGS